MVVANVSSIPIGSLSIVGGIFLVGRDADGLYAMSMECTHKGCTVTLTGSDLACTCHESRFDSNGEVLQGPAPTPLPHFAVSVDAAGNISIDRFTVVSGSERTAV
jgi:Rieske Fe-S protein